MFIKRVYDEFGVYVECFSKLRLREAMKTAMEVADLSNKYIQANAIWDKGIDKGLLANKLFILVNVIRFIGVLLEPFIPTFSAKLYFVLGLKREVSDEGLLGRLFEAKSDSVLLGLVKGGQEVRLPIPLVTQG